MAGKLHGDEPIEHEPEVVSTDGIAVPSSSDARELAMSIAGHKDVNAAIVVVLSSDGTLRIGVGMVEDKATQEVVSKLAAVLKRHCDDEWVAKDRSATGLFVDEDDRN